MFWTTTVEILQAAIFSLSHVLNGSLGWAVVTLSLTLRLALLPLTLRLARRAMANRQRMAALQPEIERIRRHYPNDPSGQGRALTELYQQRGVRLFDPAVVFGGLAQAPLYAVLYAALRKGMGAGVRFLSLRDVAAPSVGLSLIVAGLTVAGVALAPSGETTRRAMLVTLLLTAGGTLWFFTRTSALFALASTSASLVNLYQSFQLRRVPNRP